jgi:hypothetical protein
VELTTIEVIITLAKTAAERLDVVAESKLDTKSLTEAGAAQHALANLRQHLFILQEQLRRLYTDSADLHRFFEAKENPNIDSSQGNPARQARGDRLKQPNKTAT